jgi:hypothetical protein
MLLLAPDTVTLYPAGPADSHGWRLPGAVPTWAGPGNLQLGPGLTDVAAADSGGHGPHDPASAETGTLYLPPAASPAEGMTAVVRGAPFTLGQVRYVSDPLAAAGGVGCWVATATSTEHG